MDWADGYFDLLVTDAEPAARRRLTNCFEGIRAVAIGLKDHEVFNANQRNTFVHYWLRNQEPGNDRQRLPLIESEQEEVGPEDLDQAWDKFRRSRYLRPVMNLYKHEEITREEVHAIMGMYWRVFENMRQGAGDVAGVGNEGALFIRMLRGTGTSSRRRKGKGKERERPGALEDHTLGRYKYIGSFRTDAVGVPPAFRGYSWDQAEKWLAT